MNSAKPQEGSLRTAAKSITLLADPMGVAKSDCTSPRFGHENPWELFKVFAHEAISISVIFADGSRGGMYKEQWGYSGGFRICIGGKGGGLPSRWDVPAET